jgi:hypothetical protein
MESSQQNNITETTKEIPIDYNLDLSKVLYQDTFRIISGSAAQLICGVQSMLLRISLDKETDEYKKALYPKLRIIALLLIENFTTLLKATSAKDQEVRKFNLCGYNGQIKPDKYGKYPFVKGVNPNTKYGYTNFGYFLKMLKQRMVFIISRDVPQRYVTDIEQLNIFTNLRNDVTLFIKFMNDTVETEWNNAVKVARLNGGTAVQQNLEQRQKIHADRKLLHEQNKQSVKIVKLDIVKPDKLTRYKPIVHTNKPKVNHTAKPKVFINHAPKNESKLNSTAKPNKRFVLPKWVKMQDATK